MTAAKNIYYTSMLEQILYMQIKYLNLKLNILHKKTFYTYSLKSYLIRIKYLAQNFPSYNCI